MRVRLALALVLLLLATTCVHKVKVVVPVIILPLITWTVPLSLDDDVRLCVETALMAGVNPEDVLPLRCTTVGTLRVWIRAQRLAN